MDIDWVPLKLGIDNCLAHLSKLKHFSSDGDGGLVFKGDKFEIEAKQTHTKEDVEGMLKELVRDKENIVGALKQVSKIVNDICPTEEQQQPRQALASSDVKHRSLESRLFINTLNQNSEQLIQPKFAKEPSETRSIPQPRHSLQKSTDPKELKLHLQDLQKENEALKEKQEKGTRELLMDEIINSMKKGPGPLREEAVLKKLIEKNAGLIDRLAAEMNARIGQNESSLENIRIHNRPTKVADEYKGLMSNGWLEAKEVLDERSPEDKYDKKKHLFLTGILDVAYKKAEDHYYNVIDSLAKRIKEPLKEGVFEHDKHGGGAAPKRITSAKRRERREHQELPPYLMSSVNDYLRQAADFIKIDSFVQAVEEAALQKYASDSKTTKELMTTPNFSSFLKQSCRLTWKMIVQRPRMDFHLDDIDKEWSKDMEKNLDLAFGSQPKNKASSIKYYRYPALYHGDKCLVKGVVFVE